MKKKNNLYLALSVLAVTILLGCAKPVVTKCGVKDRHAHKYEMDYQLGYEIEGKTSVNLVTYKELEYEQWRGFTRQEEFVPSNGEGRYLSSQVLLDIKENEEALRLIAIKDKKDKPPSFTPKTEMSIPFLGADGQLKYPLSSPIYEGKKNFETWHYRAVNEGYYQRSKYVLDLSEVSDEYKYIDWEEYKIYQPVKDLSEEKIDDYIKSLEDVVIQTK